MASPYSLSRSTFAGDLDNPRARGDKTKQSQKSNRPPTSPRRGHRHYFDDDSGDDYEQQPIVKDATRHSASSRSSMSIKDKVKSTSASMAAASEANMSEYEHWKAHHISRGRGCESSCSNGTETIAVFGDVVTEVFDLINEVAFPEVMDVANGNEDNEIQSPLSTSSYREDDDSVFVRSAAYAKSKKAKEFLGFIGAVKSGNKPIISTPAAPSALLVPSGIPLNLLSESSSIVETETTEEEDKVDKVEIWDDRDDGDSNDNHFVDDDSSAEVFRSKKSDWRSRDLREKIPDRYSSVDGSYSSDDSKNEDDGKWTDDWNGTESKNTKDQDYEKYIMDVINNEKEKRRISPSTGGNHPSNPILPFSLKGAASIKSAIAKRFTRANPKYSKPPSVGGSDKPELLTIIESSDEEGRVSEEENVHEKEVAPSEEFEPVTKVQIVPEGEVSEGREMEGNSEVLEEAKTEEDQIEKADKTNGTSEEEYNSSTASGSSYSSSDDDDDDRTYLSYTGSYDSFLDIEDRSVTSHTRDSMGIEDQSLTYSIGAKDSLLDVSISQHSNSVKSNENSYYDSTLRRTISDESSKDTNDANAVERKASVVESLLAEDDEEERSTESEERSSKRLAIEPSRFCSVYDNLYPSDSLFSFATQDETLFDFSNSNIDQFYQEELEPPPSILADDTMVEAPSVLTDKSDVEEYNDKYEPTECDGKHVAEQQRDELQENEEREETVQENEGQEDAQRHKTETGAIIDAKDDQEGNGNSNKERDIDEEERDAVEENKTVDDKLFEASENEHVSRISEPFASAVYGNAEKSSDSSTRSRTLPPRRHYRGQKKAVANTSSVTNIEDRQGKNTSIDEGSNSNRSSDSSASTETVDTTNQKAAADMTHPTSSNNPTRKGSRRNLSRLKMYDQRRQNILKLTHKAE